MEMKSQKEKKMTTEELKKYCSYTPPTKDQIDQINSIMAKYYDLAVTIMKAAAPSPAGDEALRLLIVSKELVPKAILG